MFGFGEVFVWLWGLGLWDSGGDRVRGYVRFGVWQFGVRFWVLDRMFPDGGCNGLRAQGYSNVPTVGVREGSAVVCRHRAPK